MLNSLANTVTSCGIRVAIPFWQLPIPKPGEQVKHARYGAKRELLACYRKSGPTQRTNSARIGVKTDWVVAACVFSHWLLDLVVHAQDMPLIGHTAKAGFGLWRYVAISIPPELIRLSAGVFIHARTWPSKKSGRRLWYLWAFCRSFRSMEAFAPHPNVRLPRHKRLCSPTSSRRFSPGLSAGLEKGLPQVMQILTRW